MARLFYLEIISTILLRVGLFTYCRKFLLRSLYHDLHDLSASTQSTSSIGDPSPSASNQSFHLDTLPPPSTQAHKPLVKSQLHSVIARSIFAACFSESSILFSMLVFQALGVMNPCIRLANWNTSLAILLCLILLFVPMSLSFILALNTKSGKRSITSRILFSAATVAVYFLMLSLVPLPEALSSSSYLSSALPRLIVIGTVSIGCLSGFGAINNTWAYLPLFLPSRSRPTIAQLERKLEAAESSLARVCRDLDAKKAEAHHKERRKIDSAGGVAGWFTRVVPSFKGDDYSQEIIGLDALQAQMTREVDALKDKLHDARVSKTTRGRILNFAGQGFAIYCVVRLLNSTVNLVIPSRSPETAAATSYPDVLAQAVLSVFVFIAPTKVNRSVIVNVSRQVGLVLVGVMILTSLRLVLRAVTRALRITNKNLGASLMLLLLAQLMGTYLLSTIVQMRTSFPPPPVQGDENLFTTIPAYEVFGSLFDGSFILAAVVTFLGRWGFEKVNGAPDL